jgi:hypothetical protein
MPHKDETIQTTQQTQPKKGEPIEIPVPKEDDFEKLVRRAVKAGGARSVVGGEQPDADEDQ